MVETSLKPYKKPCGHLSKPWDLDDDIVQCGWKEYEFEMMRDSADNVIALCTIENFDPVGVHTGDAITVAPSVTLTDREFQKIPADLANVAAGKRVVADISHTVRRDAVFHEPRGWSHAIRSGPLPALCVPADVSG